jgi:hypothetical protein
MHRLVVAAALVSAACGTSDDERPKTLEYITVAILAPSCGNAQCHSSFRRAEGLAFDTVAAARDTINADASLVIPGEPADSQLFKVLISPGGDPDVVVPRMPYDQPLPNADIELIEEWIEDGAPGL